jgi:D-sedoheptulose 7-phosphate isomerase
MFPQDDSALIVTELEPSPQHAIHRDAVVRALVERRRTLGRALARLALGANGLAEVAARLVETLERGGKVLVAGNGGSAAEAQHFAAELVGRFKRERAAYPVLALTTDTAILTAVANDYGYADVFARQVRAFAQPGDLFLGFSTSGESENLARALVAARERGMASAAITGERASRMEQLADVTVRMPLTDTATVQELHMMATHILCEIAEAALSARERLTAREGVPIQ